MYRNLSLAVVAGLAAAAHADVTISDFNDSAQNWLVADGNSPGNQSVTALPDFFPSDGNDQGFITTPITWITTAFFVAPEQFLGDHTDLFGGTVSVDRRFTHPDSWADSMQVDYPADLTITGLDGSMTLAVDLDLVSLTDWQTASVEFSEAGQWFHLGSGVAATGAEIMSLLGDLEDVRVRGNIRDSFARVGIDNFAFNPVPTPGAVSLMALAGLAAARRRR